MEEYGLANARRCPAGPGHRGANFPENPRAVQEGRRQVPRSHPEPDLELQRPIEPAAGGGIEGSQREGAGGSGGSSDEAANQGRPAASWLCLVERRWYDVLRQLDLLRLIHRGRQSDGATRSFGPLKFGHTSWLGLVLAGESPRALQPRVVRRGRQALGS